MEENKLLFSKIKISQKKAGVVLFFDEIQNNTVIKNHEIKCYLPIHRDLLNAIQLLKPHLIIINELNNCKNEKVFEKIYEYSNYFINSLTIKYDTPTSETDYSFIISSIKKLTNKKFVNFNTPLTHIHEDDYPFMSDVYNTINKIFYESQEYLNGKNGIGDNLFSDNDLNIHAQNMLNNLKDSGITDVKITTINQK